MATYQECRRLLADELGVDPGPGLQELYLRLVRSDPALATADSTAKPTQLSTAKLSTAKPASLAFVGRTQVLRRANEILDAGSPGPVVIVFAGMGGVGKTTTALHWAHRMASGYPDGQLYADLRGYGPDRDPASPAEILDGFLRALGVAAADIPEHPAVRAGLFRSLTTGRRMLLLLDNAASADVVRELLPGSGGHSGAGDQPRDVARLARPLWCPFAQAAAARAR